MCSCIKWQISEVLLFLIDENKKIRLSVTRKDINLDDFDLHLKLKNLKFV